MTSRDQLQTPEGGRDFQLPGGCMLCGGDLAVRLTAGTARTFCPTCRWISSPLVRREDGEMQMIHPGGVA